MGLENEESGPPIVGEADYKRREDGEYIIIEKTCKKCSRRFTTHIPKREPGFKFRTRHGGTVSVRELEEDAKAQKLCPQCKNGEGE